MRSKFAAIGTGFYLLAVVCASIYPVFDRRTFSGLIVVLLAWPWIDYLPSAWLPLAIVLNAIIIFGLLAVPVARGDVTSTAAKVNSNLPLPKIPACNPRHHSPAKIQRQVHFTSESGHQMRRAACPLCADIQQSRRSVLTGQSAAPSSRRSGEPSATEKD